MKRLGIIGGLGPMATALFMQMIIEMTDAGRDQDHIEMIIFNCPGIPDRTNYILGRSNENPYPELIKIGKQLIDYGAELLAIPCVTATYFEERMQDDIQVPILNIIQETVKHLTDNQIETVGLLATDGTMQCGLFQKELNRAGIHVLVPESTDQKKIMDIIYKDVKAGNPINMDDFFCVSHNLKDRGAEVIILGCTELSIVRKNNDIGAGFLDAMQVLAKCSVENCGTLLDNYKNLITK